MSFETFEPLERQQLAEIRETLRQRPDPWDKERPDDDDPEDFPLEEVNYIFT